MVDVKLYLGDCLQVMRGMADKSVDLIFVDPPYNIGMDYGTYKDDMPENLYFEWCIQWISEAKRVGKSIAVYPPKKHLLWFWNQLPDHHQIICAWSPEGAIRSNFVHQYIPLLVPNKPVKRVKDHWWNVQAPGMGYFYREEKFDHPGQTSLDITGRVIDAFTDEGDTVMDFFMGVGTTGYWCVIHNRSFYGIDIDPTYYAIAERRIHDAQQQMPLFGMES